MELTFVYPEYLWFLIIIPIIAVTHFYGLKHTKRVALKFSNFEAISRVSGGQQFSVNIYLTFIRVLAILFIISALSSPILWYTGKGSDFDYILAIDSSGSMLANDIQPNRLEAAKNASQNFIDFMSSKAKIGVLSFTGTTFVKQMPTDDFVKVRGAISSIKVEKVGGTAIGEAIVASTNLLLPRDNAKILILLTDGQNNVGVTPEEAIRYANENKVTIHTIGIGTDEGAVIEGTSAVTKIDEEQLERIAKNTGGNYYRVKSSEELEGSYKEIAGFSKKKIPVHLTFYLILAGILFLFLEWLLINTKFRTIP